MGQQCCEKWSNYDLNIFLLIKNEITLIWTNKNSQNKQQENNFRK